MKTSNRLKQKIRQLRGKRVRAVLYGTEAEAGADAQWRERVARMSYEEQVALAEVLSEEAEQQAQEILTLLANVADSADAIAQFRLRCPDYYDVAKCSNDDLLKFRNELRAVWQGKATEGTLERWYHLSPFLDGWLIFFKARIILPTGKNFRAMAANICAQRAKYLKQCANPECSQYFIAQRTDAKYCLEPNCLQYGNRVRAYEHWRGKHPKSPFRKKRGR